MLDGFLGLGHDAVVGRYHQNHDVGGLRTAGTHGREGLVTGGIEERHHAAWGFDVVGANVLRDTTSFARRHLGAADVVQQRGLAVVHVAHDGDHRSARQQFGVFLTRIFVGEGFWIVQRRHHGLVAHFFHHDHGGVLVQRLVDGDHLAHLHQGLDHFRGLDRHLVCQLCHRDGFRHMHFDDPGFHRCGVLVIVALIAVVTTAATGATTPVVAAHATTAVAASLDFFLLGRVVRPAGGQLGRLDFLARTAAGSGWCGSTRIAWACAGTNGRLVQGALLGVTHGGRLGCWLGFLRLFGHHDGLLGRRHHRANGLGFRQGLAATLFQITGTRRFFFGTGLGLSGCLFAGFILGCSTGSRFGLLLACSFLLLRRGLRLLGSFLGSIGGGALFSFAFTALALFTLSTFGSQFSFLVANQLSLAAGFFLAANQFLVLARHGGFFHRSFTRLGGRRRRLSAFIALDEGALLAHFHLDRAGLACGIGLLDLAGGLLHHGDLLAIRRSGAMAGLQVGQQFLLVRLGQGV